MNLITVTYNANKYQLVPKEPTPEWVAKYEDNVHYQVFAEQNIREVLAAAPQPETLSPWLPIETAPKDGVWILGYSYRMDIRDYPLVMFWDDGWCALNCGSIPPVTHWMPLPAPPKPEQGK